MQPVSRHKKRVNYLLAIPLSVRLYADLIQLIDLMAILILVKVIKSIRAKSFARKTFGAKLKFNCYNIYYT